MNKDLCELIVVLDRSGSMSSIKADMEGGFKNLVEDQKKQPGECRLTLVQFDSNGIDTIHESKPIKEVDGMTLNPRGMTPLLDAVGDTIDKTGARLKGTPEASRPGRVIFLIITDGMENASTRFTFPQIKEKVERQTNVYKWDFMYLGANVDAFDQGGRMGISGQTIAAYGTTSAAVAGTYYYASQKISGARGMSAGTPVAGWTDEERKGMQDESTS